MPSQFTRGLILMRVSARTKSNSDGRVDCSFQPIQDLSRFAHEQHTVGFTLGIGLDINRYGVAVAQTDFLAQFRRQASRQRDSDPALLATVFERPLAAHVRGMGQYAARDVPEAIP